MKIGIMQPYFFPYIGYWQLMNFVDMYVIYDDVNYIKGGWINRNKVLVNGESKFFNIFLQGSSSFKNINEIEVQDNNVQKQKTIKTIEQCYSKAPNFDLTFPIVCDIFEQKETNLAKYLEYAIRKICDYLDIKTELIISSKIEKDNELKAQDKVISICKVLGGTEYVNAIGGQELYSVDDFENKGIKLSFLKTGNIVYKQFNNEFIPNLSIIDVMMFNTKEEITEMLNNYEL